MAREPRQEEVAPDLGSTFVVRLPLAADRLEPAAAAPRTAETRRGGGLRILVADDNRDAATSLGMVLELDGHHVEVVHDGGHALDAISRSRFDLALLDIGMPNVNGYDVARRVRADNSAIMLVAVTGWGKDSDRDRALAAGFDHHWVKPIEPAQALELCARRPRRARIDRGARSAASSSSYKERICTARSVAAALMYKVRPSAD